MSVETKKETIGFQAEVSQLLHLMIHSLYSNKEIFLRELISNASDAVDRLKFEAISKPELLKDDSDLKIWVDFNKEDKTLTIKDNGIGMNREDLINHLGTIAKSGTKDFLKTLTGDKSKDSNMIGQFGVGFYSAFIVADKVSVYSRKAGEAEDSGTKWTSTGEGNFELESVKKADRGTEIVLHLKEEEDEFLNSWHLKHIIKKYSDHITLPIVMKKEPELKTDEKAEDKNSDIVDILEDEVVNSAQALWTQPKQDISDEQYHELYKNISHDFENPLTWSHNKVEGKYEYTSVLFIPSRAPFDLWQAGKARGLKLYVQRVFIMDDAEQFIPHYLRFARGVIDSNDLPLNVSREILQGNKITDAMKNAIVKRILDMLAKLAKDDAEKYATFWKEFGQVLKEGPAEDFANKDKIAKLLRFASTHTDKEEQNVSIEDYIKRMPEGQDKIYYVAGETFNAAKNSPHLEVFRKKGIEVLLLSDRVDEWLMSHLTEFDSKKFQSVAKGGLELGDLDDKEAKEKVEGQSKDYKDTIEKMQKILDSKVKEIRLSHRLTTSPACIVADEHAMTPQMERIMKAAGQNVPTSKPILELNPEHLLIQQLKSEESEDKFADLSNILLDQAILSEGGQLDDPASFVKRFNELLINLSK